MVRSPFLAIPKHALMYYPLNVGRNMEEIKRSLIALQTSDEYKVAMPLDWKPGEKVIIGAPRTVESLLERKESNLEMVDWYLAVKTI